MPKAKEESVEEVVTEEVVEESLVATPEEPAVESESTEEEAQERKHKNRESTSEKAKRASAERVAKGLPAAAPTVQLDPLRLRGKKYRAVIKLIDRSLTYTIEEALALVKKTTTAKFDEAVEMHIKIKGDAVRGTVVLPGGSGKTKKVAVASDETLEAIAVGKLDFDVLLATPAQMPKLAKFAKLLGPKGLMPSPKAGTVTDDIDKVKEEISGGRVEYRADKTGVIHLSIGRVSFDSAKLTANYEAMLQALANNKLQSISIASTMGPGVRVQLPLGK